MPNNANAIQTTVREIARAEILPWPSSNRICAIHVPEFYASCYTHHANTPSMMGCRLLLFPQQDFSSLGGTAKMLFLHLSSPKENHETKPARCSAKWSNQSIPRGTGEVCLRLEEEEERTPAFHVTRLLFFQCRGRA